jgi:hypothetical protein
MRAQYKHPVQLAQKEERKLLSSFYRQMARQPREAVPQQAREFAQAQRMQREMELISFLRFNPWREEIMKAVGERERIGKEVRNIGIGIAVCGAVACFASPALGAGIIAAGAVFAIAGARKLESIKAAEGIWEKVKKSAEAQMST